MTVNTRVVYYTYDHAYRTYGTKPDCQRLFLAVKN